MTNEQHLHQSTDDMVAELHRLAARCRVNAERATREDSPVAAREWIEASMSCFEAAEAARKAACNG